MSSGRALECKAQLKIGAMPFKKKTMQYNAIYHVHTGNSFQENKKKAEIFPKSVTTNIYRNGSVFFFFFGHALKMI